MRGLAFVLLSRLLKFAVTTATERRNDLPHSNHDYTFALKYISMSQLTRIAPIAAFLLLSACDNSQHSATTSKHLTDGTSSTVTATNQVNSVANSEPTSAGAVEKIFAISGHFTQKEKIDSIFTAYIKKDGSDGEDNIAEFQVLLSGNNAPAITVYFSGLSLKNEGDLNGDGLDEFTIFGEPNHGCTIDVQTYTVKGTSILPFIEPFLYSTGCDEFTDQQKQDLVFAEKGTVYFMEQDVNDENMRLVKKKAIVK